MFAPIYARHNIPTSDRATLTRYFNKQNGIPASIRHYFLERKWSRFIKECSIALTRRFIANLKDSSCLNHQSRRQPQSSKTMSATRSPQV